MKKFFKSPEEAKKSTAPAVSKILKKVFSKGLEGSRFFYKADFEYETGEKAPFMYIGPLTGLWKKYIQASKRDKDFVAGICQLTEEEGRKKLLMEAKMGKGSKALFLKAINKELLKKLAVKAEFVETLAVTVAEEDEEEETQETDSQDEKSKVETAKISPQKMATELKNVTETFKNIKKEHNPEQIDQLLDEILDWEDNYKTLSPKEQEALAAGLVAVQKVAASLQQTNQIDSRIDMLMDKIYPLIEEYIGLEDDSTDTAIALKDKLERNIVKIEVLAQKINDNTFIEVCQEFRAVLES